MVTMLGVAMLGPWIGLITKQFKRIDGSNSPSAYSQLTLGGLLILEIIFPLMLLEVAVFRPDRPAAEVLTLSDLCWIPFIGLGCTFLVEVAISAVTIMRDRSDRPVFPDGRRISTSSSPPQRCRGALSSWPCPVRLRGRVYSGSGSVSAPGHGHGFLACPRSRSKETASASAPVTDGLGRLTEEVAVLREELRLARERIGS
jgi:hypothetical protein